MKNTLNAEFAEDSPRIRRFAVVSSGMVIGYRGWCDLRGPLRSKCFDLSVPIEGLPIDKNTTNAGFAEDSEN
jgi:hypothetical protein